MVAYIGHSNPDKHRTVCTFVQYFQISISDKRLTVNELSFISCNLPLLPKAEILVLSTIAQLLENEGFFD